MLHALIIDDEYNGIRSLELLIKKFIPEVKIVAMTTNPVEGIEFINNYRPDIVFLDINMPSLNGFELLERIEYKNFHLIFTTAHQEYAIRAIKQSAIDYLLKPIDVDALKVSIERIQQKMKENVVGQDIKEILKGIVGAKNLRVPIPTKESVEFVIPSSIIYIEAHSNASKILLTSMNLVEVNKSLKEYELLLCKEGLYFMRIHNSFIVNLNYVLRYLKEDGGQVVLHGNKTIPVSKNKKWDFFNVLNFNYDAI